MGCGFFFRRGRGNGFRDLCVHHRGVGLLDFLAHVPLDETDDFGVLFRDKAQGLAHGLGAAGTAGAVDIGFRRVRDIVVYHVGNPGDVQAPGRHIRGHQNGEAAVLKALECLLPLKLGQVALDAGGFESGPGELVGQLSGLVPGPGKDQGGGHFRILDQGFEQGGFLLLLHLDHGMGNLFHGSGVGNLGRGRVLEQVPGKFPDFLGHGGGKNQGLAFFGEQGRDLTDVGQKALVKHLVGLVQDQDLNVVQGHDLFSEQVHESTGTGHNEFGTAANFGDLGTFSHTAEDGHTTQSGVLAQGFNVFVDLEGQLPGGGQNENPVLLPGPLVQPLEQGQDKGRGFSRAGLGQSQYVTALKDRRNGGILDGGGPAVTAGRYPGLDLGGKFKFFKTHSVS